MFQKNAIGKFLSMIPAQISGSWITGAPPSIILKRIDATRLIVGHMIAMVPACLISVQKYGLSVLGLQCFSIKRAPILFPQRLEKMNTKSPM